VRYSAAGRAGDPVRAIRLPNGNLLVSVELDDPDTGFGLVDIGPDDSRYGTWLALSEDGEDPRPAGA